MQAASREIIEHAALLHDVADWKYSGSENASRNTVQVPYRALHCFQHCVDLPTLRVTC
jgi:hypothetical protein